MPDGPPSREPPTRFAGVDPFGLPRMVMHPIRNRLRFLVESLLLRGTLARLGIAVSLIALVAVAAGLLGYLAALGSEQAFRNPLEAIWWAFLRLSDPGYLGDDHGLVLRLLATVVTLAGYVLFVGVLVAILTQGLNERIRRLEMGLAPISVRNHLILLGWSRRTPAIVRNLLASEHRVKRFLRRIGARRLRLVLLVQDVTPEHTGELRTYLGRAWRARKVILRSGSPLRLDHLKRVDYLRAGAIVLPAEDRTYGGQANESDDSAVKTILSVAHSVRLMAAERSAPLLVAEFYDARKIPIVLRSYHGPIEVVASDEVVSRMVAQMVRHPRISHLYRELLTHASGNEFFARDCPSEQVGTEFWKLAARLPRAILIGVTRPSAGGIEPLLNPPDDYRLGENDKLVYIAEEWQDIADEIAGPGGAWPPASNLLERRPRPDHRILVLGWSRRLPAFLSELESYRNQRFEIVIASRLSAEARKRQIADYSAGTDHLQVTQVDVDYTVPKQLEALEPAKFDTVLCLASDLTASAETADARTLVAYAILHELLPTAPRGPHVLVELLDELNAALIDPRHCEYLLSPEVLSHMLVQVALRRELNALFRELFSSNQSELFFRDCERYGLAAGTETTFPAIQAAGRAHGEVVLGVAIASRATEPDGGIHLNPDRRIQWKLQAGDQLVVLGK